MQAVMRLFCLFPAFVLALSTAVFAAPVQEALRPQARPQARPEATTTPPPRTLAPPGAEHIRPRARPPAFSRAMDAIRAQDWAQATRIAAVDGPVARDLVTWHKLRAGEGTYPEYQAFLARRSDWPGLEYMRAQSEDTLVQRRDADILAQFGQSAPQTVAGLLAHAAALERVGRKSEAQAVIITAWRNIDLTDDEQRLFLTTHGGLLADHHVARLDQMLWRGAHQNARRMFSLVSGDQQTLARARISLRTRADDANALLRKVPEALSNDPGLSHARFEWRVRSGNWDDAKDLLAQRSASAARLGQPEAWSNRRRVLARDELRDGNARVAYALAAQHHLTSGSAYADLEWLAGYIALTKLDDPKQALAHFENHDRVVRSPISQGRAGYWKGRAHQAMGNAALADMEFTRGASFQTSFYGLLAAEAAGLPFDVGLEDPIAHDWALSPLARDSLFQAGLLLAKAGERSLAERFWRHLADQLSDGDVARLGQAAIDIGEPHLAVMIGKTVARRGVTLARPYYALHPLVTQDLPVATEMALAIARRESEFDPVVRSGVGALGLMQLMPATAQEVAGQLGLSAGHSVGRLTQDPVYNATLGATYLARLSTQFGANIVMMSAGYNAGPSRPVRWMREYGDPRGGTLDNMIDWIEGIPFRETRNYVMRVSESLPVYRARLGKDPLPVPFSQMLLGSFPGR